jgi:hypothetical protein
LCFRQPRSKKESRLRKLKRLEKANGVGNSKGNMLDYKMDFGSMEAEQREDEQMGAAERESERFVVDEHGVIDLTG